VTCREFTDFIAEFLDGGLPGPQRLEFQRHLCRCANCMRYLDSYRTSVTLARRAFADGDAAVPSDVPQELVDAILRVRRTSPADRNAPCDRASKPV
jgi:anti-sigma factor RsiW